MPLPIWLNDDAWAYHKQRAACEIPKIKAALSTAISYIAVPDLEGFWKVGGVFYKAAGR
jgi:hypothetical protein